MSLCQRLTKCSTQNMHRCVQVSPWGREYDVENVQKQQIWKWPVTLFTSVTLTSKMAAWTVSYCSVPRQGDRVYQVWVDRPNSFDKNIQRWFNNLCDFSDFKIQDGQLKISRALPSFWVLLRAKLGFDSPNTKNIQMTFLTSVTLESENQ